MKLRVHMRGLWPFVVLVTLMFVAFGIACLIAIDKNGLRSVGTAFLLCWIMAEIFTAILYFNCARFTYED